ncbi:MAG: hypothetical protein IT237_09610 [Bacteroidia bacterium]|nr:hypothetical protein [Bacteroidia bacterium]HRO07530.1 NAD(P)-dependent oxidoreductase [Saprospiraceae bacterium]HRP40813.1 NAD(P)-dependent oxidoreductase [Saprospiraceae bacterium]
MQKLKLYIAETEDFSKSVIQKLQQVFEIINANNKSLKTIFEEVDIFWFRLGYEIDDSVLSTSSKCKYIVTPVTGIDHINENLCNELGVKVICLRGEEDFLKQIRATAEHTMALTLALIRNIVPAVGHTHKGQWQRDKFRGTELYNKKVSIIGYGRLGQITSEYFNTFGCFVGFYDIVDKEYPAYITMYNNLKDAVKNADIISIHLPFNESTHKLLGKEFFEWLKSTSIIINTSRGGVMDEKYLLEALQMNKIKGAALDVLNGEPNVHQNHLIEYARHNNNLIITPHIGGNTYESFEKTEQFVADKLIKSVFPYV